MGKSALRSKSPYTYVCVDIKPQVQNEDRGHIGTAALARHPNQMHIVRLIQTCKVNFFGILGITVA